MIKTKTPQNSAQLRGLAQILVVEGLLDEGTTRRALNEAKLSQSSFVNYLVTEKLLNPNLIASIASRDFGVPLIDLSTFDKSYLPLQLVSEKLIRRHNVLPLFKRGHHLFVATSDPSQQRGLNEIKFHTGLNVHYIVVNTDTLTRYIEEALSEKQHQALGEFLESSELNNVEITNIEKDDELDSTDPSDDTPIVRFIDKVLLDAINKGASDIHFEPYEQFYRVRFRLDGILYEIATPPSNLANRIASRLKVMSQLDISERRLPQDGRFKMKISPQRVIDFRISTCPTVNGEKLVMRILDPASAKLGIEALGFDPEQRALFEEKIHLPQGMILVTGPTGSGKTMTLYTALNILNDAEKNISTAEDPVEIKLNGINQVHINTKTGLTFASTLRAFLRQDPDIIMVGEMRDLETAEIGIKSAQTGHLVFSTLHTNSSPETLTRLVNMGVAPFNIATSVSLIIAQRLARKLCPMCKQAKEIPLETLRKEGFNEADLDQFEAFEAIGCDECTNGYRGRIGIYEILPVTKNIGTVIMKGGTSNDILNTALSEGLVTLRQSGLHKVKQGITSLEEINRVTKD